ncbi:MAG: phosphatidylserine decarboxylase [Firmicutes bacterium]|nr:phosphatidylserine decarboxylase [Bacillota bacterium]
MLDQVRLALLSILPVKIISRWFGWFARGSASRPLIPLYARCFKIDLSQVELEIGEYASLTDFFVRRVKPELRPIDPNPHSIVSPVDGLVSALGIIETDQLFQAKGVHYRVTELLACAPEQVSRYYGGSFITIYLSPRDYHRIHTPIAGKVTRYTYVPGTLFPVNPFGVRAVQGLFARNERLITYLATPAGEVAMVKVGATLVGSVRVVYADDVTTNVTAGRLFHGELASAPFFDKGKELGRFEFGSTVILLFEKDRVSLRTDLQPGERLLMGQAIGHIN